MDYQRLLLAIASVVFLGLIPAAPAGAHAFLDHAIPRVGSTAATVPRSITLWFNQELEPAFSSLQVLDAKGERVDSGDAHIDSKDPTMLTASLKPLAPGTYKVRWRVVSLDTHVSQGDYTFRVASK